MSLVVTSPPAAPAVSLAEAKAHLRVEHDMDDAMIAAMVAAAQDIAEAHCQRRFITQTVQWAAPALITRLPLAPVDRDSVVVEYVADGESSFTTWPTSNYVVRTRGSDAGTYIAPVTGFDCPIIEHDAAEPVRITFDVGAASAPDAVKAAILLMTGDLYKARETFTSGSAAKVPMSTTVETLLRSYLWNW